MFHKYPKLKKLRIKFLTQTPAPTYQDCSNVKTYGKTDIKLTHGLLKLWYPQAVRLDQVPTLIRLSNATFPLVLMERKGMTVDLYQVIKDRNILFKRI